MAEPAATHELVIAGIVILFFIVGYFLRAQFRFKMVSLIPPAAIYDRLYRQLIPRAPKRSDVSVQVLVLGDIGRSPRMQYHALSIAQNGGRVQIIGYHETPLVDELDQHELVSVVPLRPAPRLPRFVPFIISGPFKVVWQYFSVFLVLLWQTYRSDWLLVQNPPSIPTLFVAALVCPVRRTRLLIDWHNYGWSILAGTRGARHPFVRISKWYESFYGRLGDANLVVTSAMARQLRRSPYLIRSPIHVLHDRPAALFRPIASTSERLHVLTRILESKSLAGLVVDGDARLVVSSTSWTPDEDFQMLLYALVQYCARQSLPNRPPRPPLLVIITGKGPQKDMYRARIDKMRRAGHLDGVEVRTAFLPMDDYASLLAAADLGVCLHMSSSGVDLPMKVVDMFGAGLPVVAYSDYESFGELVKDGVNGRGFKTSGGLSDHLAYLLSEAGAEELARLKEGAMRESNLRWSEEWDRVVAPILGFGADSRKEK